MYNGEKIIFLDAETDGLYGHFLSVAIVVTTKDCQEIERHYYGICSENLQVREQWVSEHVLPIMGDYTPCSDERELLENVWQLWEKYREDAYAISDVAYPVEARLFMECVKQDEANRRFCAPYPLLDLSNILYAKGFDPLADRKKLAGWEKDGQHNALEDVLMAVEIYRIITEQEISNVS